MPLGIDPGENNQAQNASVTCHTAIPDPKDAQRVLGQHVGPIEQYVSQATAHKYSEKRRIKDEIADLILFERAISFAGKPLHQIKGSYKTGEIGGTVPANAKLIVDLENKRVEVMNPEGHGEDETKALLARSKKVLIYP